MTAAAALAVAALQYSPPPPPPLVPVNIVRPGDYVATCTARAGARQPFAVRIDARGAGRARKVRIRSAEPSAFPQGRARSRSVRRFEAGRTNEILAAGELTVFHTWYGAAPKASTIELLRIRLNEPVVTLARGTCALAWRRR